ncbi:cysteine dioxygenase type I [Colletotrichum tofieldiae]|uniref:Cysteine dioxygenase n=1 Tax=Colletotrichum tofieldiae TaxID=708197 RepID=A0A166VTB6_9PEZI|nr:cysteine dioxygenase type I [Colletotrichum tofieldiae]GKT59325.1 cysteine dioxygenase type I [Colletotrichum tofieldiae]GKT79962.1 cysteine dioxygenase type I [Colletotrichum tofieldiae]
MALDILTKIPSAFGHDLKHDSNRFDKLVLALKEALGPSSGLDSADVDVKELMKLMEEYNTRENEWIQFAFAEKSMGYTRNLVDEGNGKSNLLVLVWSPGKGSPIHDHGNAHCLMKILKGDLTEIRYAFPGGDEEQPMKVISERTHKENAVAYMADELGVHRVCNRGSDFAVSLHLYTPPNVAKGGCNIFNEKTSKSSHVAKCGYYSAYGRRLPKQ